MGLLMSRSAYSASTSFFALQSRRPILEASPWNLSSSLLDKLLVVPGFRKGSHVKKVGTREPLHGRELVPEVLGQALDNLGSPGNGAAPCCTIPWAVDSFPM